MTPYTTASSSLELCMAGGHSVGASRMYRHGVGVKQKAKSKI